MFTLFWILSSVLCALVALYRWFVERFDYFVEQGIPGPTPRPLFGTSWAFWKLKLYEVELERYRGYGRIYGTFDGRSPNLFIGEPALIRKVLIQDFDHFRNRRSLRTRNAWLNNGLSSLRDQDWMHARAVMSPAFSVGKIKRMDELMCECAEMLVHHLLPRANGDKKINIKAAINAYTMDVIASCAFGTKIDSLRRPNNSFISTATKIFSASGAGNPLFTLIFLYPNIARFFIPASMFSGVNFFAALGQDIIKRRRGDPQKEKRDDFLDLLIEAAEDESETQNPLKDEVTLVAQVLLFLLAGFDTTALTISLTVYFLALNPDVQAKAREEIRAHSQKYEHICYDLLHELPYLEQCISETLRMWPPAIRIERVCNKSIDYDEVSIREGCLVTIPILAIHRDPHFYPDPMRYDPERFSHEEKSKRDPMTFLPFGAGKRQCIGMRFALEEVKLGLCHLLTCFNFFKIPETVDPPIFERGGTFGLLQNQNIWVGIERVTQPH